jgi:hypothetical protein
MKKQSDTKNSDPRLNFSDLVSTEFDSWRAIQLIQNRLPACVVIQAAKYLQIAPLKLSSALSLRRTLVRPTADPDRQLNQDET